MYKELHGGKLSQEIKQNIPAALLYQGQFSAMYITVLQSKEGDGQKLKYIQQMTKQLLANFQKPIPHV